MSNPARPRPANRLLGARQVCFAVVLVLLSVGQVAVFSAPASSQVAADGSLPLLQGERFFETFEGVYGGLDASTDGNTVVVSQLTRQSYTEPWSIEIAVIDRAAGTETVTMLAPSSDAPQVVISNDGQTVFVVHDTTTAINVATGAVQTGLPPIHSVVSDGSVGVGLDGLDILLVDLVAGSTTVLATIPGGLDWIGHRVAISGDGSMVAATSLEAAETFPSMSKLFTVETATGALTDHGVTHGVNLYETPARQHATLVELSENGSILLFQTDEGPAVMNVPSGLVTPYPQDGLLNGDIISHDMSPDGSEIAVASRHRGYDWSSLSVFRVWRPDSGETRSGVFSRELNPQSVRHVRLTNDPTAPAIFSRDNSLVVWTTVPVERSLLECRGEPVTVAMLLGDNPTEDADVILGTSGDDIIEGLGGNDRICGSAGDDIIRGGDGDDTIFDGEGNDKVFGGPGNDRLTEMTAIRSTNQRACIYYDDVLNGGPGDDWLSGSGALHGGDGADRIIGRGGCVARKVVTGGPGDDRISVSGGNVATKVPVWIVRAGSGDDRVVGDGLQNLLRGGPGNDVIRGSGALYGNRGNDRLVGGDGNDLLEGGGGSDELRGNGGDDVLRGGRGSDQFWGGPDNDTCTDKRFPLRRSCETVEKLP